MYKRYMLGKTSWYIPLTSMEMTDTFCSFTRNVNFVTCFLLPSLGQSWHHTPPLPSGGVCLYFILPYFYIYWFFFFFRTMTSSTWRTNWGRKTDNWRRRDKSSKRWDPGPSFMNVSLARTVLQGKNYPGAPGDFAPEVQKRALENKKGASENYHRLQCTFVKVCLILQI